MARIFFALNGKKINSLEELRENFNAKQMLAFYKGTRLHKWLEEQGLTDELENLNSFDADMDDDTLLSMLMALFELSDEQIAKVEAQMPKPEPAKAPEQAPDVDSHISTESPAECTSSAPDKEELSAKTPATSQPLTGEIKITWSLCNLPTKPNGTGFVAESRPTDDLELGEKSYCSFSDERHDFRIGPVRFCNGFFMFAAVDPREGHYNLICLKSRDGICWEEDKKSDGRFLDGSKFIQGSKHCFAITPSEDSTDAFVYSEEKGWYKFDFDFYDTVARGDTKHLGLLDIVEKGDNIYLLTHNYVSHGFFSTDYWYRDIISAPSSILDGGAQRYTMCRDDEDFDDGAWDRIFCFKDKFFVTRSREDRKNDFQYCEDDGEFNFSKIKIASQVDINTDDFYSFKDIAFVNSGSGAYYTVDGKKWQVCDLPLAWSRDNFMQTSGVYVAIGRTKDYDSQCLCCSSDGIEWKTHKSMINVDNGVAGNGIILLFNGGDKYLLGKIEGATQASTTSADDTSDYLERVKAVSAQVKVFIAKELGVAAAVIKDDTDIVADLHAEEWRLKLFGYQLGELLGVKFPNGEIPTKVIDIVISVVKNKN